MTYCKNQAFIENKLINEPKVWLITGVAGFIGSHLLEFLLNHDQQVVGLDNFSTGSKRNLEDVKTKVVGERWENFKFIEGDICIESDCLKALNGVDHVLHQAALGSVPRSIKDPMTSHLNNVTGFLNILNLSYLSNVSAFVYASSSSVYGDSKTLPKEESHIGKPLSPYAFTKLSNEIYADIFYKNYGFVTTGLRYFNVFGPRQLPDGPYAAVIPKWINNVLNGEQVFINGNGETSRDFTYIDNVVQANILSAYSNHQNNNIYNIAFGGQISLNDLFTIIKTSSADLGVLYKKEVEYRDFRKGDVMHSNANISRAKTFIDYDPQVSAIDGIKLTLKWYKKLI